MVTVAGVTGWPFSVSPASALSTSWPPVAPLIPVTLSLTAVIGAAITVEIVLTAIFVLVILGVTHATRGTPALAGLAIGLGTYSGGWRIMRTMGRGLVHVDSPQGITAETASTVAILASSHLGFALSTTHICTGSVLGTGIGRGTKVSWGTFGKMAVAWLITLPCAGVVGALTSLIAVKGGTLGLLVVIVLLIIGALLIVRQANHNKVDFSNVNDADQVVVATTTRSPDASDLWRSSTSAGPVAPTAHPDNSASAVVSAVARAAAAARRGAALRVAAPLGFGIPKL